jgi:hypothetical protein
MNKTKMIQNRSNKNRIEQEIKKNPQMLNPNIHLSNTAPEGLTLGPPFARSDVVVVQDGDPELLRSPTQTPG